MFDVNNSRMAAVASQLSIAAQKKSDFRIGWEAARTPLISDAIKQFNNNAVDAYALKLANDLGITR